MAHRRDETQDGFAEIALDVELLGVTKAAVCAHRARRRFEKGITAKYFVVFASSPQGLPASLSVAALNIMVSAACRCIQLSANGC